MGEEVVHLLTGAGIVWVSMGLAALRARRKAKTPDKPLTRCGCRHDYAMHDLRTGECHGKADEPTKFNTYGNEIAWKKVPCTCRHYTGPIPLEQIFQAPPPLPRQGKEI